LAFTGSKKATVNLNPETAVDRFVEELWH